MPNAGGTITKHSLAELKSWSSPLLLLGEQYSFIKREFINIAKENSPYRAFKFSETQLRVYKLRTPFFLDESFDERFIIRIAGATRWLAIIKRDYPEEFDDWVRID